MKDILIGVFVAAAGGLVVWYVTSRAMPAPNTTPSAVPLDLSAGAHSMGQEFAPAPAGYFVDPNTSRLVQAAARNAATFLGSGGTVTSERWPAGHRYA